MATSSLPLTLPSTVPLSGVLSLLFVAALITSALISLFLIYHWYAYGEDRAVSTLAALTYLAGIAAGLLAMGGAVLTIL